MDISDWPAEFFITGTDTGIGKTVVSAILSQGLNASYWKPVQAGLKEETDTEFIERTTEVPVKQERFALQTPMSPHAAAKIDKVSISLEDFNLPEYETDHLVVEGAGGLLVPLNDSDMIIDLIAYLQLPVVLVARSTLGTLNHTLLSLEALRERNIPVLGVVLNGPEHESNRQTIKEFGNVEILAEIDVIDPLNPSSLEGVFEKKF